MEPQHRKIAEIALAAGGPFGFALAGGYALREHGMGARPSGDVDLFTDWQRRADFSKAVDAVISGLATAGYTVTVALRHDTFARLLLVPVSRATDQPDKLELAADWRAHPPVTLDVGPVLHADDAVANKVLALFGRAEARDFLDIDAAITSGYFSRERMLQLAAHADSGFDSRMFADAIGSLEQRTDAEFDEYGVSSSELSAMRKRFAEWREHLAAG